jgi:hypothetical protein
MMFNFAHIAELLAERGAETPSYLYFPSDISTSTGRLLGLGSDWFQFEGDLKLGYSNAERDETYQFNEGREGILHTNQAIPRFFFQEILITPQFFLRDRLKALFQARLLPNSVSLKEGYAAFYPPFQAFTHAFIKIGLDRRFFSPRVHKTIIPPIVSTAFGEDQDLQIVIGSDFLITSHLYWKACVANGQRLSESSAADFVGKQQTYPILSDARQIESFDTHKEAGLGVGFTKDFSPEKQLNLLAFSFFSKLNEKDPDLGRETVFLQHAIPGYFSEKRDRYRAGFDLKFEWNRVAFWTQYIHALDGEITRDIAAIQPSYAIESDILDSLSIRDIELIYRWNFLNVAAKGVADDIQESPFTWDRATHTFALNLRSKYFFSWQNEFHLNLEKTGGAHKDVKNNEFLSQLTFYF